MKNLYCVWAILICFWAGNLRAAEKPAPEMEKLSKFVGKWKIEETAEASPFGPAAKSSYTSDSRYIHGGHFLKEEAKGKTNGEPITYSGLYFYDAEAKTYRSFYYDSSGLMMPSEGTFDGAVMKNRSSTTIAGKKYDFRGTTTMAPDSKTFTYEVVYSEDGSTWKGLFKGSAKRIGK